MGFVSVWEYRKLFDKKNGHSKDYHASYKKVVAQFDDVLSRAVIEATCCIDCYYGSYYGYNNYSSLFTGAIPICNVDDALESINVQVLPWKLAMRLLIGMMDCTHADCRKAKSGHGNHPEWLWRCKWSYGHYWHS